MALRIRVRRQRMRAPTPNSTQVYTALGSEVTFVEAMPNIMPGFDREIAKLAQRLLIQSRPIDFHTNVIASKVTPGEGARGCVFQEVGRACPEAWQGVQARRSSDCPRLPVSLCPPGAQVPLLGALLRRLGHTAGSAGPAAAVPVGQQPTCPCAVCRFLPTAGVPGVKPVKIELTDFTTKEVVDELEVDACLVATGRAPYTNGLNLGSVGVSPDRRGFIPVNEKMQVGGGGWVEAGAGGVWHAGACPRTTRCAARCVEQAWRGSEPSGGHAGQLWRHGSLSAALQTVLAILYADAGTAALSPATGAGQQRQGGAQPVLHRRRQR